MSLPEDICRILGHEDMMIPCSRCGWSPIDPFVAMTKDPILYDKYIKETAKRIQHLDAPYNVDYQPEGFDICGFALDKRRQAIRKKWYRDVDKEVTKLNHL